MTDADGGTEHFDRESVVWHDGLFRGSGRPWLVLSDDRHPFHGEEYLVVGLTTTARWDAIELDDGDWRVGGLPRRTYASPWFLTTLKHAAVDRGVGMLRTKPVDAISDSVVRYVE